MAFPWLKTTACGPEACPSSLYRVPLWTSQGWPQSDYRFAFFTGVSSTLCWPLVRAPGGLASLLRLVEGESCAFDLQ